MLTSYLLLPLALLFADGGEQTSLPVAEVASKAMFEICIPLIANESFDEVALLGSWGARRVSDDASDRAKYELQTSGAGTVDITILADRTVCSVHYVGSYSGVDEVKARLVRDGWEGRAALTGQVWRKNRTFAATSWAQEATDGPYEGRTYVVHPDSNAAIELAEWFSPQAE